MLLFLEKIEQRPGKIINFESNCILIIVKGIPVPNTESVSYNSGGLLSSGWNNWSCQQDQRLWPHDLVSRCKEQLRKGDKSEESSSINDQVVESVEYWFVIWSW